MPLSEHEQRLLNEIEQALYAEDPKFASSVRSARPRNRTRLQIGFAVLGVVAGIVLVVVGLAAKIVLLGVAGFVLIVGAVVLAVNALRGPRQNGPVALGPRADSRNNKPTGLRMKMEDRMRRRFDEN